MKSIATAADMRLAESLFSFIHPEHLPLSFRYGGRIIRGLPAEFSPRTETRRADANLLLTTVRGRNAEGLEIRVEIQQYLDFPAVELLAFFTNASSSDTPLISDVKIVDASIPCGETDLFHGNGDTLHDDGYEWFEHDLSEPASLFTSDGTSCNGAFPYFRLRGKGSCVSIAVGWPAMWRADLSRTASGVYLAIGQKRSHMVIHPGETMRTPRATFIASAGDETRSVNMWRRWYLTHILPRENGQPLPPKCCMHVFGAEGKPEFTGASQSNQLAGIADYLKNGVRPDIWWIDAGWYPCDYEWPRTGTWQPDSARFPNGLAPIGEACDANAMQLLLWFEPERVRPDTELDQSHPEWLLRRTLENGSIHENRLLNLGNPECCDFIIERVDSIIKASRVRIYRQDFNFAPAPYWEQAESADRIGAVENLHVQGYLRYWDALLERNPGLWIDSCASGGRRNDLETMRRAVPLHYTDVGYGNHPIKQKQHHQMFAWIPYFRAHNMNWDDPTTGEYGTSNHVPDRFSYHCAMAPALTDMLEHDADAEAYALAREMQSIWRKAAALMLSGDYYPLTACRKSRQDFYAVQFHDPDAEKGFFQIIRNNACPEPAFAVRLNALDANAVYRLIEAESGEVSEFSAQTLTDGLSIELPLRTARIFFYERIR